MVRILYDDRSIRLGENAFDQALKHLVAVLFVVLALRFYSSKIFCFNSRTAVISDPCF